MKNYLLIFALGLIVLTSKVFAQSASLSLSGESHDINLPVEITANSLSINQSSNSAIFEGTAYVGQGSLRLSADKIVVSYDQETGKVTSIEATGKVIFTNGEDVAEAESAIYKIDTGLLKMSGNVLLVQGKSTISGNYLDMNILENIASLTGNVKTTLAPN